MLQAQPKMKRKIRMNRVKYLPIALAISLCATPIFADDHYNYFSMDSTRTPDVSNTVADNSDDNLSMQSYYQRPQHDEYARTGHDYYIYGGYVFSYHFNDKTTITSSENLTTGDFLTISPKTALPDTFHAIEIGFGKQWGQHLDFQIAYLQQFEKTKTATGSLSSLPGSPVPTSAQISSKGIGINFVFLINPNDPFQVGASFGAHVEHYTQTVTATNTASNITATYILPDDNTTEIDPTAGLQLIYSFTPEFAIRLHGTYIWHTQSKISSGEINAFVGFSYIL